MAFQWTDDPGAAAERIIAGSVNTYGEYLYTGSAEDAESILENLSAQQPMKMTLQIKVPEVVNMLIEDISMTRIL